MRYDWHPGKAAANLEKHRVSFEAVVQLDWSRALVRADLRYGYGEVRLNALAPIGRCLYHMTFTVERRVVWVISLRPASRKEVLRYAAETTPR
ncbi:BrnT family toxin [Paracraurococcus lichenis]|uniref:BrnT family toxin n=1 Tax=Paracraurococcus lichenis TaxID=3064888 RepID=A0ABT9E9Q3_9PROT|nr:BrnT family toxin [Paracraurococcus sp. LOR1-02]MDO9712857.1 BrnT family toxin [Paracraurococcus sp. LOR1-02]